MPRVAQVALKRSPRPLECPRIVSGRKAAGGRVCASSARPSEQGLALVGTPQGACDFLARCTEHEVGTVVAELRSWIRPETCSRRSGPAVWWGTPSAPRVSTSAGQGRCLRISRAGRFEAELDAGEKELPEFAELALLGCPRVRLLLRRLIVVRHVVSVMSGRIETP